MVNTLIDAKAESWWVEAEIHRTSPKSPKVGYKESPKSRMQTTVLQHKGPFFFGLNTTESRDFWGNG